MDRRQFLKSGTLATLAFPGLLRAQPAKRVLIVGAGAAGLTAAYQFKRAGVDVNILEAAPRWGGRIARLVGFAEFPLDLGAEWIHGDPNLLGQIIGRGETDLGVETLEYRPQTYHIWQNERLRDASFLRSAYAEAKFLETTWYGFFERFIVPKVHHGMYLNATVSGIDYGVAGVAARLRDGRVFNADRIIVTVPISVLKQSSIQFTPALPQQHLRGLRDIGFGSGFKVFLKFRDRFYPDILLSGPLIRFLQDSWDQKVYYDAAFGKLTQDNILGLFTVAQGDLHRARLSDSEIVTDVLGELTQIYGDIVMRTFQDARVQNWTRMPHILGSYSMEVDADRSPNEILTPIGDKVFFAGEALGGAAQSTVHGAALSAQHTVNRMLDAW